MKSACLPTQRKTALYLDANRLRLVGRSEHIHKVVTEILVLLPGLKMLLIWGRNDRGGVGWGKIIWEKLITLGESVFCLEKSMNPPKKIQTHRSKQAETINSIESYLVQALVIFRRSLFRRILKQNQHLLQTLWVWAPCTERDTGDEAKAAATTLKRNFAKK
jgi:hypothetical protein